MSKTVSACSPVVFLLMFVSQAVAQERTVLDSFQSVLAPFEEYILSLPKSGDPQGERTAPFVYEEWSEPGLGKKLVDVLRSKPENEAPIRNASALAQELSAISGILQRKLSDSNYTVEHERLFFSEMFKSLKGLILRGQRGGSLKDSDYEQLTHSYDYLLWLAQERVVYYWGPGLGHLILGDDPDQYSSRMKTQEEVGDFRGFMGMIGMDPNLGPTSVRPAPTHGMPMHVVSEKFILSESFNVTPQLLANFIQTYLAHTSWNVKLTNEQLGLIKNYGHYLLMRELAYEISRSAVSGKQGRINEFWSNLEELFAFIKSSQMAYWAIALMRANPDTIKDELISKRAPNLVYKADSSNAFGSHYFFHLKNPLNDPSKRDQILSVLGLSGIFDAMSKWHPENSIHRAIAFLKGLPNQYIEDQLIPDGYLRSMTDEPGLFQTCRDALLLKPSVRTRKVFDRAFLKRVELIHANLIKDDTTL